MLLAAVQILFEVKRRENLHLRAIEILQCDQLLKKPLEHLDELVEVNFLKIFD
jgi:hypothetical protein